MTDSIKGIKGGQEGLPYASTADKMPSEEEVFDNAVDTYAAVETNPLVEAVKSGSPLPKYIGELMTPYPSLSIDKRLELYDRIPEADLTTHTKNLKRIGWLRRYFQELTPQYIEANMTEVYRYARELAKLTYEVISIYTLDGFHPAFAISRLRNEAFRGNDAVVLVLDLNVRALNTADESKALGNWYLPRIMEWVQDNITGNADAYKILKRLPTVVQMPQRTSFIFAASNAGEAVKFKRIVFKALSHFEEDMRLALADAKEKGLVPNSIDAETMPFRATGFFTTLDLRHLDTSSQMGLSHLLNNALKVPVSTAAFFKSHKPADPSLTILEAGGITLFGDNALPEPGTPLFESLQYYLNQEKGFVPFGVYIPLTHVSVIPFDQEYLARLIEPDLPMEIGRITRRPSLRGGGWLERFFNTIRTLTEEPELAKKPGLLGAMKKTADKLTAELLRIGEDARRDPFFKLMMNPMTSWHGEPNDFFREQTALQKEMTGFNPFLLAGEGDNAGKWAEQHPPKGRLADDFFQDISWQLFRASDEMDIPPPVAAREGDQWRAAAFAPTARLAEKNARLWQYLVKHQNASRPIVMPDGSVTHLTVSVSLAEMPDTSTPEGARQYAVQLPLQALHAEHVKHANGPGKEGFGWLPEDFGHTPLKMSVINPEELRDLVKENLPPENIKLEPMTTPITPPGKYDGLEAFLPASIPGIGIWDGEGYILQPDFGEPLPPPEPMTTPAAPQLPGVYALSGVDAFPSSLAGGIALEALNLATPNISTPKMWPQLRPAVSVNGAGNPLYILLFDSAEWAALSMLGATNASFLDYAGGKYEIFFDSIGRMSRYNDCRYNPKRDCIEEFGPLIGGI